MEIGQEMVVSYMGCDDTHYIFTGKMLVPHLRIPRDKIFGTSILGTSEKYVLHKNTASQYTVRAA